VSKRRNPLGIVERVEDIPAFANEREEADFWQSHRFSDALLDAAPPYTEEEAPPARPSAAIALRIDPLLLTRLQRLAAQRDVPYQRLLKQFVEERVVEEEAVAAAPAPDPALVRELARSMARRARELERDALRLTAAS
jgi:predicted DNA binding CopG/RHH family protein